MATTQGRNLHSATQYTRGIVDTRKTSARELTWVSGIGNDLNNAIASARTAVPLFRNVNGVTVPLDTLTATYISDTRAFVAADYRFNAGGTADCGFNRVELSTGYENIPWIRLGITSGGKPSFDALGRPGLGQTLGIYNEVPDPDGGTLVRPYMWTVPVWHLHVTTVLTFNPAQSISKFMRKQVNADSVTWDKFAIRKHQIRFNGASIRYKSKVYFVEYNFSIRGDGWFKQVWDASTNRTVEAPMYATIPFAGGSSFPVGPKGSC